MNRLSLFLFSLVAVLLGVLLGDEGFINPFSLDSTEAIILSQLRVPRILIGLCAGGVLGLAGLVFQSLFRNDLASPYTLGVSSGAAFGASVGISLLSLFNLSSETILGFSLPDFTAFIGANLSMLFILGIGKVKRRFDPATLILSGVVVSFFFASGTLLIQVMGDAFDTKRIIRWTLGNLSTYGYEELVTVFPALILCFGFVFLNRMNLNIVALGDRFAHTHGIQVQKLRIKFFAILSIAIGLVIAEVGPISFVGLIAPHIIKKIYDVDFRVTVIPTVIFSGAFLVLCDVISRILVPQNALPVGIITALLGAPFFLYLILTKKS